MGRVFVKPERFVFVRQKQLDVNVFNLQFHAASW